MISLDLRDHPVCVVAFSGLAPLNHLFEWRKTFLDLPVSWVGVRDPHDCWYQKDVLKAAEEIDNAISATKAKKIVFLGGSAGGFGALMFGRILNPDRIIAFSPQTVCGEAKRLMGDDRWPQYCDPTPTTEWSDLKGHHLKAEVHYAEDDPLDALHAERVLAGKVVTYREGGHRLAKELRATGELQRIVERAIIT